MKFFAKNRHFDCKNFCFPKRAKIKMSKKSKFRLKIQILIKDSKFLPKVRCIRVPYGKPFLSAGVKQHSGETKISRIGRKKG